MSVQSVAQPLVDALRGKQAAKGTREEAEQKIADLKLEIEELKNRPPTTSPTAEQKRLDDLTIAERTLSAWQSARDGFVKEQAAQELAKARAKAEQATAAASSWLSVDADALWGGWEAFERGWTLSNAEYQATALLSYLKSPSGNAYGRSALYDSLRKYRDSRMEELVELKIAKKVSRQRGLMELERIK